jgi:hypothetical protein
LKYRVPDRPDCHQEWRRLNTMLDQVIAWGGALKGLRQPAVAK